ncbi:MAG: GNAT family N-acetyltransferase [Armatimonadetes bacterium]|nr:GNAT family N-acetyltransferase [Armatimonadota bacterium]
MSENTHMCRMEVGDIAFGMSLKEIAGWNQLPVDWERFQEYEPDGCFVVRCDGRPAGTVTTIAYEQLFGWVGMVLVHPDMRRRGLGTALLMGGIQYLERHGVAAVKLDATPMGKELYDTIGFVDEYRLARWQGHGCVGEVPEGLRELGLDDLETLAAFDLPIFGADRRRVLRRLLTEPGIRVAAEFAGDDLQGYAALRPGQNAVYLGPWVALDGATAERLWQWGRAMAGTAPMFVDVLDPCPYGKELVCQSGFEQQRELIRMYRGRNLSPGRPDLQCGILGPETG